MSAEDFNEIFKSKTGIAFKNIDLLERALTHDSCGSIGSEFERMEFLGDACLELSIAAMLISRTDFSEGKCSQIRSNLTRKESLAEIMRSWNADANFVLGKGMNRNDLSDTIYADMMESVLGALYSDQGYEVTFKCINLVFEEKFQELISQSTSHNNPKSRLQEYLMSNGKTLPEYTIVKKEGPAHSPTYTIKVSLYNGESYEGEANSIKNAEQMAATHALTALGV